MFRAASRLQPHGRPVVGSVSAAVSNATTKGQTRQKFPLRFSAYFSGLAPPQDDNTPPNGRNNIATPQSLQFARLASQPYSHRHIVIGGATFQNILSIGQRRGFASQAAGSGDDSTSFSSSSSSSSSSSVDDQLDKLFRENEAMKMDATAEPWVDGSIPASSGLEFIPTWYNPADQCLNLVFKVHELSGLELGMTIIVTTFAVRVLLLPVVISGQQSASRMAHLQPELTQLKEQFERISNPTIDQKQKLGNKVQQLFRRYEVRPARSMIAPFIQFPFFMGMFFGLKKMPDYFPEEMANGGMLWFPDLTMPDPNYILPGVCFFTFLATVEMGKEQMFASNPQNAPMMINVFRGLSLMMIPICVNFHTGMLCYWTVSNLFTLFQIGFMKIPAVKRAFGIWDPPKPVPGAGGGKNEGFMDQAKKALDNVQGKPSSEVSKMKQHNERIESKKRVAELSRNSRERRRRAIKKRD